MLTGGVRWHRNASAVAEHGRYINNFALLASDHILTNLLTQNKSGIEVYLSHVLPLLQWEFHRRTAKNRAAIVHQHIDLAVNASGFISESLHGRGV